MVLTFKYIMDLDRKKKCYPKDSSLVSLFMTPAEDFNLNYFIYAACTKSDYSTPDLIRVSKDTYDEAKNFFKSTENVILGENLLNNIEEISILLHSVSDVVDTENQTIGTMLNLNDGGDKI